MIDTSNTSPKYWEAVLAKENLSMSRGRRSIDTFAEKMYCADMATRLQEAGQELPAPTEVSGCTVFLDNLAVEDTTNDE